MVATAWPAFMEPWQTTFAEDVLKAFLLPVARRPLLGQIRDYVDDVSVRMGLRLYAPTQRLFRRRGKRKRRGHGLPIRALPRGAKSKTPRRIRTPKLDRCRDAGHCKKSSRPSSIRRLSYVASCWPMAAPLSSLVGLRRQRRSRPTASVANVACCVCVNRRLRGATMVTKI